MGGSGEDVLDGRARVIDEHGNDVMGIFLDGAEETVRIARRFSAKTAILKEKSPSCGCRLQKRDGETIPGEGVTAARLRRAGIEVDPA